VVTKHCLRDSIFTYTIFSWILEKFLALGKFLKKIFRFKRSREDVHSFQFLSYKETVSTSTRVEKGEFHITKT